MSFDQENKSSKKPMLSSMKKRKSPQTKKRPQWKKVNHSVIEPSTNIT